MRTSRSARRAGLNSRIERDARGGVSTNASAKAARIASATKVLRARSSGMGLAIIYSRRAPESPIPASTALPVGESAVRTFSAAALALAAAAFFTISCGGIVDPSKNQMQEFSGTVTPQGFTSHSFSVNKTGEISVKITALAPLNNVPLGILWAQADSSGACVAVIQSGVGNLGVPATT